MKKIFSILSLLLLCSIATMAESKVEIAETANGTITSSLDGQTVTLTVTPATGYYIRKSDITVQKTVDPSSGVRRGGIPVASALTLDGNDPEALSSERTYTFDIPAGYNAYVTASFTTCTAITLGVSIENWTYGETAKTPSVTGNTGNAAVSYTYATKGSTDFSATMPSNAGDYTVKAVIPAIDIYTAGEATKDFTISQKALTITADAKTKVYGTEDPELTYQVEGLIEGESLTGALTRAEGEDVGKYAIMQGTLAASDNYSVTFTADTLTITAATLADIEAQGYSGTYDGKAHTITVSIPEGASIMYGTADGSYDKETAPSYTNAGESVVYYQVTKANYNSVRGSATVTISQKTLTITADAKTKVYGTEDPELTYQVDGLIEGENLTGALTRAEGEEVGKYAITQGTLAASDNYSVTFTADTLTITPAILAGIEAQGYSGTYDGKAHTITVSIPEGASIMYGTADGSYDKETAPSYTNAGESMVYYQVTKANYNSVRGSATVNISQKALTITADAKTKVYGTDDPELTYQVEGLIEGESLTGALTRAEGEDVGKYAITQGTLAASDNYSVTFIGDTLTITALPAVDMDAFVTIDGVVFYEVQDKQILESLVNTDMVLSADAAKCFKLDSETGLVFNQGPDVMFALLGLKKGDVLVFKFVGKMLADGQMLCKKTNAAPARRGGGDMVLESDVEYEVLKDCDVIITVALAESSATVSNITKTPVEQINAIKMVKGSQQTATGWYTIDGRKLDKQPAAKGIYIRDGRKIIIR